jgi:hypothetical protein
LQALRSIEAVFEIEKSAATGLADKAEICTLAGSHY